MVRTTRQGIWDDVVGTFLVLEREVVFLQQLHPTRLTTGELWLGWKMLEGRMVGIDNEVGAIEVVPPSLEGVDHSQQFLLMRWIVAFSRVEFSRGEGNWA